jgi:CRISPR-associated protein Cas1
LDEDARLKVVCNMYAIRFGEVAPERRSVDQLRGIEGVRVRKLYELIAKRHGVEWKGRDYDPRDFGTGDIPNRCLSAGTSCLYGLAEAAVLAAGDAPAIGFLHTGKPLSFVYDVADMFKFETVVPEAFRIAGQATRGRMAEDPVGAVRRACRDVFRKTALLERLIPAIEEVLAAGEIAQPETPPEAQSPAFPDPEPIGDAGHRG